jgi:hypothetical protein
VKEKLLSPLFRAFLCDRTRKATKDMHVSLFIVAVAVIRANSMNVLQLLRITDVLNVLMENK